MSKIIETVDEFLALFTPEETAQMGDLAQDCDIAEMRGDRRRVRTLRRQMDRLQDRVRARHDVSFRKSSV